MVVRATDVVEGNTVLNSVTKCLRRKELAGNFSSRFRPNPSTSTNMTRSAGPIMSAMVADPGVGSIPSTPAADATARERSTRLRTSADGRTAVHVEKAACKVSTSLIGAKARRVRTNCYQNFILPGRFMITSTGVECWKSRYCTTRLFPNHLHRLMGEGSKVMTTGAEPADANAIRLQVGQAYDYFSGDERRRHVQMLQSVKSVEDVAVHTKPRDNGEWTVTVSTSDCVGALSIISGLLAAYCWDILRAHIFTLDFSPATPRVQHPRRRNRGPL